MNSPAKKPVTQPVGMVVERVLAGEKGRPSAAPVKASEVIAALSPEALGAVENLINRLFREIRDVRPAWRQAWPTKEAMESAKVKWVVALVEAGCTDWDRQIEVGLRGLRAEASDFVPSPGKFVAWCTPTAEALGLQSVDKAFAEACRNAHTAVRHNAQWSHPVTYHAAIDVGLDVLMFLPGVESRKVFERSYAVMTRRLMTGQGLGDGVALGIGHDSSKTEAQLAEEHSLQQALRIRELQGIPSDGAAAREALLANSRRRQQGAAHG